MSTRPSSDAGAGSRSAQSRGSAAAREEVFAMLKDDHKKVKASLREFEKLHEEGDADACMALVRKTCSDLLMHAQLEEEVFYPAVRGAIDAEELVDEAVVEHRSLKELIEQLADIETDDPMHAATFRVLGEYVRHHVREEEGEMFEQVGHAKLDWISLLNQMQQRRQDLEGAEPQASSAEPTP